MDQARETRAPRHSIPAHEQDALKERRRLNKIDREKPAIGLALSGGGVRSATFCLGLLRALAKNGVLHRFDYLSTVSGGGYIGSAFGRLFSTNVTPAEVEKGLADDGSLLLWWLRSNGRYLVPAGARDLLQTWASQLRGFIATQFEVTTLLGLLSCLIVLPHMLGHRWDASSVLLLQGTLWWVLTSIAFWVAIVVAFLYWWSRDPGDGSGWGDFVICLSTSAMAVYLLSPILATTDGGEGKTVMAVIGSILLAVPVARTWLLIRGTRPAQDRVRYTIELSTALKYVLLFFALGMADLISWFLADRVGQGASHSSVLTSAGLAAMLVAVARFALPMLQSRVGKTSLAQLPLALMANLCGLILIALLVLFWLSALQYFVFVARLSAINTWMHWLTAIFPGIAHVSAADTWLRWLTVWIPCLAYVCLTGSNLQLINRSSLHSFYRSRIARTYVAVGNSPDAQKSKGPTRFQVSPLAPKSPGNADKVRKLTELLDGDDIDLPSYVPHAYGGPIHLINCCINQTIDDRTDTYNADRKGIYLTVSSLGLETGTKLPQPHDKESNPLKDNTLSEWIAISGAAAGSGMGSLTRTGTAAMFFLSGFRLGYWWCNRLNMKNFWWSHLGKSRAAMQEMLARFPGLQSPVWYLSDGGHFDNSGVYSLLKRELGLIVLADCGADPTYVFADMENLIRKARIDLETTIDFIDPASLRIGIGKALCDRFGTPDSIMSTSGNQHLLLARITYPSGASGCLLVVKPRVYCDMPLDVAGYAARHRDFPQQSTAEQFFDESQWESYCQLGEVLGMSIDARLLDTLPSLAANGEITRSSVLSDEEQKSTLTRRQRVGTTIGTSLSFGALATVALSAWQAWDSQLQQDQSGQQQLNATQRDADTLQTVLEANTPYNAQMHVKLYALLQEFDDARNLEGSAAAVNQLADTLNRACGRLDKTNPLLDRCLTDYSALRAAATAPSSWQKSMKDYLSSTPSSIFPVIGWFEPIGPATHGSISAVPTPPPPPSESVAFSTSAMNTPIAVGSASPTSASSTASAPTTAASDQGALDAASQACKGARFAQPQQLIVYIHTYSDKQLKAATSLQGQFGKFGLTAPSVENVSAAPTRKGRGALAAWGKPVFLYSSYNDQAQACANSLAIWLGTQQGFQNAAPTAIPLHMRLHGDPNVIEFWIPDPGSPPTP
jgi:Patatin-like phospholipase